MSSRRGAKRPAPSTPTAASPSTLAWPCLKVQGKPGREQVVLDVSVSPNAKKTQVHGWHDGALRVRLAALPADGAANEALRRWLADELQITLAEVTLIRGATSRRKQVALDISLACAQAWLERLNRVGLLNAPDMA